MLPGPPTVYQSILDHPRLAEFDMSSLRLAVTGAAAVPVELVRRMRAELGFETIVTGYGLTEATGIATMCRHDDDPETIATTSGRAIPDVEVQVVDEKGVEVARGEPGEIVIRGYNVMQGFIHDPEATAEAIDREGWLHTGDMGSVDSDGYFRLVGRREELIRRGDDLVFPREIEEVLLQHPSVADAAVVGVPGARGEEAIAAFVVPRSAPPADAELLAHCADRLPSSRVPTRWTQMDRFPLTPLGKVQKHVLRQRLVSV
jgi:HIP---CoA ligase